MTIQEFEQLKVGDFVRLTGDELFVVIDDYVWGPPNKVCLVQIIDNNKFKQCLIDLSNCKYWVHVA